MSELGTREKLLCSAMKLFAEKGYSATGVDEIAGAIGIKGPNLYKYFKGKTDLLDAIIKQADEVYNERMGLDRRERFMPTCPAELKAFTMRQLDYTMGEGQPRMLRRIFTIEQFRSERFAASATRYQITNMQDMYAGMFGAMMQKGILKPEDPETLAFEYIAPITLMIQLSDREPDKLQYAKERIEKHIDLFAMHYMADNGKTDK